MSALTVPTPSEPSSVRGRARRMVQHSGFLTARAVRALLRQPAFAAITLVQPVIWLLLFGQLFRNVVHIPGFSSGSGSYLEFITPGVIVMTALFSSGWAGTVFIEDMDRGVMDRLLAVAGAARGDDRRHARLPVADHRRADLDRVRHRVRVRRPLRRRVTGVR